jgi:general secretion pathway protein A
VETVRLADYLMTMDIRESRYSALKNALEPWHATVEFKPYLENLDDDPAFFRLTAKPVGFLIHRLETDIDLLDRLDLPAILELFPPGSEQPGYLTLSGITDGKIQLQGDRKDQVIETNADEIQFFWSAIAYIPWKNFLSIWGTIPLHTYRDSIITLKLLLQELGYKDIAITDEYDDHTRQIIEEIQARYGIPVDGFVGPLTKIILYRQKNSFEMPHLMH